MAERTKERRRFRAECRCGNVMYRSAQAVTRKCPQCFAPAHEMKIMDQRPDLGPGLYHGLRRDDEGS